MAPEPEPGRATEVADPVPPGPVVPVVQDCAAGTVLLAGTRPPRRTGDLLGPASVQEQLHRVGERLLAEAGGDPAAERDVQAWFSDSCTRFESARVRRFVPILVERDVRQRLRDRPAPPPPGAGTTPPDEVAGHPPTGHLDIRVVSQPG